MRKFLWLVLAPFPVWIAWGAAVAARPDRAADYFPYFWFANDVAIVAVFAALLLWVMGYGKPAEGTPEPAPAKGAAGHQRHL